MAPAGRKLLRWLLVVVLVAALVGIALYEANRSDTNVDGLISLVANVPVR